MSPDQLPITTVLPPACDEVTSEVSAYLDGAVTGVEMRRIADHLATCPACAADFARAELLQRSLATLGTVRPPANLSLRLRVAVSQERSRSWQSRRDTLVLLWQNTFRQLVLQTAGGLAAAVVLIGGILSLLGAVGSRPVLANDEPLGAMTAPHYLYSIAAIAPLRTPQDDTLVVDADINARGEAYDFRILSGPQTPEVRRQVTSRLVSSVFRPASVFGVPIRGHLLLTFSGISVPG